jgi:FAD/FMN-containing dehydrogenase
MAHSTPDWEALKRSIAGVVELPDSDGYERASRPFNARFDQVRPLGIVRCASPQDVAQTLAFVRRLRLEHATRSGGHSFAGGSSTGGLLIDVSPMRSVSVDGAVARIGVGASLGDVYEALHEHGLAIPAGTCPPVGIAGLTLGGGLGILGRKFGVTSDSLIGAEVVLADGRVVRCDEHHDADLFWTLRGAGAGTLGVVTSLEFRTVPEPAATNFHLSWPYEHAAEIVEAWQGWAPTGPDELAASLKVTASDDVADPPSVDVYGALIEGGPDAGPLIEALLARVRADPSSATQREMSFPETRRFWADLGAEGNEDGDDADAEPAGHPYLFCRSEFFARPLPAEAIAALLETFSRERAPGESRELDFMPWGGAYNRVPSDATAFVHRDELFLLKHSVVVDPSASAGAKEAAHRQVEAWWASVHAWGSGRMFQNFAVPELDAWADAYVGSNLDRLLQIKARYDPSDFFSARSSPQI